MIPNIKNKILSIFTVFILIISFVILFSDIVDAYKFNINSYKNNSIQIEEINSNLSELKSQATGMEETLKSLEEEEESALEKSELIKEKVDELNLIYGEGLELDIASLMMILESSAKENKISIAFDPIEFENSKLNNDNSIGIKTVTNKVTFSGRYVDIIKHIEYLENIDFINIENIFFINSTLEYEKYIPSKYPSDIKDRVEGQYKIKVNYFEE